MAVMNTQERLALVREAISKILVSGQAYTDGSRKLTRADLAELRRMESALSDELAAQEEGNGLMANSVLAAFDRKL